jgi:hypothetical protein
MIELYKNSENWEMVEQLSRVMVKKFKYERSAWKFYLGCEMERKKALKLETGNIKEIL